MVLAARRGVAGRRRGGPQDCARPGQRGMSDLERVRAVYDFVVTGTRYVGLEFGIHGYKPYKVTQVLARRFGDCKDKAALIHRAAARGRRPGGAGSGPDAAGRPPGHRAGVAGDLRSRDRLRAEAGSLSGRHGGVRRPDGAAVAGPGRGRVAGRPARRRDDPDAGAAVERQPRRTPLAGGAGGLGDARVDEEPIIRGQAAPNWREHYQTEGERKDRYGRVWSGRFPGARLDSVAMPGIGDRGAPVTVRAGVTVPRLARATAGGALELPVTGRDADFVRTYARLSARRQELVLGYPWQHDEELTYRLPTGWRLAAGAPAGRRPVDSPFGRFTIEVEIDGSVLRVRSSLNVTQARIAPDDYLRFRSFLMEVDAALGSPVGVSPPSAGGP